MLISYGRTKVNVPYQRISLDLYFYTGPIVNYWSLCVDITYCNKKCKDFHCLTFTVHNDVTLYDYNNHDYEIRP